MAIKNKDYKSMRKKLKSFKNWPQLANLTKIILKNREIWDVIDSLWANPTTTAFIKKKEKDNAVAFKIIEQEVGVDLYIKIIWKKNLHGS